MFASWGASENMGGIERTRNSHIRTDKAGTSSELRKALI